MNLTELKNKSTQELIHLASELARDAEREQVVNYSKQDLILFITRRNFELNISMYSEGYLEILPDGFGFLRSSLATYQPSHDDIYISPSQIRLFSLRKGEYIVGEIRPPREGERYFALLKISSIAERQPEEAKTLTPFESLTAIYPTEQLKLSNNSKGSTVNHLLENILPLGFGQRCIIHGENASVNSILFQQLAIAVAACQPDTTVFLIMIDQSPEDINELKQKVKEIKNIEFISSCFDEIPQKHISVVEMLTEKAKRKAERKENIIIMLDSITKLTKAYNAFSSVGTKTLSGGIEALAIQKAKKIFGSARNLEQGGSITILATACSNTEHISEQVIFEELEPMANAYIYLNAELAEQGVSPAIDFSYSFTKKEELIIGDKRHEKNQELRLNLKKLSHIEGLKYLLKNIGD
ncbi:transcription termination factor Rho [Desulfovibrio litoralis]|uniref:Transcription termination factor Rho n=1 Tax=Desulfovibrio litoralis DSM 11393 TaxID=1121455 RepID=A0A1M7SMA7_9BACT|nr:transcription termination factor Rho [Desulfovibrio litoralis]SHN59586.1 transcription termination factor Rho [Desulfovibrio litoralis DSM 11393]